MILVSLACASSPGWRGALRTEPNRTIVVVPTLDHCEQDAEGCFHRGREALAIDATFTQGVQLLLSACAHGSDAACGDLDVHARRPEPTETGRTPAPAGWRGQSSGKVVVTCFLPEQGVLQDCRVTEIESLVGNLTPLAPELLRKFSEEKWLPLRYDGKPVPIDLRIPISFEGPCFPNSPC